MKKNRGSSYPGQTGYSNKQYWANLGFTERPHFRKEGIRVTKDNYWHQSLAFICTDAAHTHVHTYTDATYTHLHTCTDMAHTCAHMHRCSIHTCAHCPRSFTRVQVLYKVTFSCVSLSVSSPSLTERDNLDLKNQ